MLECSGPQMFWHRGLVSWKTVFPRTGGSGNDSRALHPSIIIASAPPQTIRCQVLEAGDPCSRRSQGPSPTRPGLVMQPLPGKSVPQGSPGLQNHPSPTPCPQLTMSKTQLQESGRDPEFLSPRTLHPLHLQGCSGQPPWLRSLLPLFAPLVLPHPHHLLAKQTKVLLNRVVKYKSLLCLRSPQTSNKQSDIPSLCQGEM